MPTAWEVLVSNSNIDEGANTTSALHLLSSVKYIETINLFVDDSVARVNVEEDTFKVSGNDETSISVEITDVSVNMKDNTYVNKEI